ncbi:hypothetical protein QE152_g11165 [Popillia japonica]|uniref:Uncharacterized protein n=1 Tax=Popillia japonica TaxID=7064 RepID=A0AAW1LSE2_POPJA
MNPSVSQFEPKKKVFCFNLLKNEDFKNWVVPIPNSKNLCKCSACGKTLSCGKSELQKHASSFKHQKNIKLKASNKTLTALMTKANNEKAEQLKHEKAVKKAEIVIASYIAEHNIAFSNVETRIKF